MSPAADASESAAHRRAKEQVALACADMAWEARLEFGEGDWRADVLAVKAISGESSSCNGVHRPWPPPIGARPAMSALG